MISVLLVMLCISVSLFSADFSCRWVIDEVIEEIGAIDEIALELCGKEYESVDGLWGHIWEDHIVPQETQKATCRWLLEDRVCNLETTRNNIRRHIFNLNKTHLYNDGAEEQLPIKKARPKRSTADFLEEEIEEEVIESDVDDACYTKFCNSLRSGEFMGYRVVEAWSSKKEKICPVSDPVTFGITEILKGT